MLDIKMVPEIEARFSAHEQICAERYQNIERAFEETTKNFQTGNHRMTRIEYLLYAVIAVTLLGPGVAAAIVKKFTGI